MLELLLTIWLIFLTLLVTLVAGLAISVWLTFLDYITKLGYKIHDMFEDRKNR